MAAFPADGGSARRSRDLPVITDARAGTSLEMRSREKRYVITMGIRTACFIAMIFVPGALRWVLLGAAVFLPYVAVIFANQANTRGRRPGRVAAVPPSDAPQLTAGPPPAEVIEHDPHVGPYQFGDDEPDAWGRHQRVA